MERQLAEQRAQIAALQLQMRQLKQTQKKENTQINEQLNQTEMRLVDEQPGIGQSVIFKDFDTRIQNVPVLSFPEGCQGPPQGKPIEEDVEIGLPVLNDSTMPEILHPIQMMPVQDKSAASEF